MKVKELVRLLENAHDNTEVVVLVSQVGYREIQGATVGYVDQEEDSAGREVVKIILK